MTQKQDQTGEAGKKLGALENRNKFHAAGSCSGTAQVFGSEVVLAKTGTGTYTATLDVPLNAAEGAILVTLRAAGHVSVAHTSDTVKTITTFAADGTTATDKGFEFLAFRKPSRLG